MEMMRLYGRMILANLRSQMQYKTSFVMLSLSNMMGSVVDFLGIWAMFGRFGSVDGWKLAEVAILYGIVGMAFAIAEGWGRGFDRFSALIRGGEFDRFLVRPRGLAFQVMASELQLTRLGRFSQALVILCIFLPQVNAGWGIPHYVLLLLSIAGGVLMFLALLIAQAASCFWTIESLEAWNVLTYGGITAISYPISIYRKWLQRFFTFIVPLAAMNYLPAKILFGQETGFPAWTGFLSPVLGGVLCIAALALWCCGVKHYRSTGT